MTDPHLYWFEELCKADKREPHPPQQCESIASSSPISLWLCPVCYESYLALREIPYICSGGFRSRRARENRVGAEFGFRESNLHDIGHITSYSVETANPEAYSWHTTFLSRNTLDAWRWK